MRTRYIFIIIITFFLSALYGCSAPYSISSANPKMIGEWTVASIQLEGDVAGLQITSPVFNDVTITCLEKSNWSLNDGGSGMYTVKPADPACTSGNRKITWEIINLSKTAHYFQFFRFMAPQGVLTDRFTTYIMEIAEQTKTSMVLKYPIKYQDKTGRLVFTFVKGRN